MPQSSSEFEKTPEAIFLKATVNKLVAHDYDSIESLIDKRVHQSDIKQVLERTRSMVPDGVPTHLEPAAWRLFKITSTANDGNSSRGTSVAIEYTYPGPKWVIFSANLSGEPDNLRILSFNIERIAAPLSEQNDFTLSGKSVVHYLFLLFTAAAFTISIYAFIRCLRTKGLKRKWLWSFFTLVGFVAFSMNWTTGAVFVNFLRFDFFSAACMRDGWLGPWTITFSIPLGALLFLWKHRTSVTRPVSDD